MTSESVKSPIDQPKLIRSQFNTCLIWPLEVYFKSVNFIFAVKKITKMKVKASVKKICIHCKSVKRKGVLRVICKNKKHKQRQG